MPNKLQDIYPVVQVSFPPKHKIFKPATRGKYPRGFLSQNPLILVIPLSIVSFNEVTGAIPFGNADVTNALRRMLAL